MTINDQRRASQLAREISSQILSELKLALMPKLPHRQRQDWRFKPPQPNPALEAYWHSVFKEKIEELDAEWADMKPTRLNPNLPNEDDYVFSTETH